MAPLLQGIVIAIISMVFGSLLSFFISVLSQRKYFKEAVDGAIQSHIDINHQDSHYQHILKQIQDEKEAREKMELKVESIEKLMLFIVAKNGGELKDLGL